MGALLLLVLSALGTRLGPLPPLGRFCNPFSGFWRNAEADGTPDGQLRVPGLYETVTVVFDRRRVPHIFAQNPHDLYFAQGYVTARDRLWQMEIQSLAAAGRLAEILGPDLAEYDKFQRRLGLLQAAEKAVDLAKKDGESWEASQAYADGVNAWIGDLRPGEYPIEYKLLDYAPRRWSPVNTLLMVKNLQWTLSGGGDDLPLSNTLAKLGRDFVGRYFPLRDPEVTPVIPAGTPWDTATAAPASLPPAARTGDSAAAIRAGTRLLQIPDSVSAPRSAVPPAPPHVPVPVPANRPDPGNGSNNFVVAGSRTRGGYPILANDPHLDLGLPSIWYEIQLSAPGLSVYGVSLPGAPAVLIGFNRKIAWGSTNGGDDVFDWYRITFKDSTLSEYLFGGQWKPTTRVIEAIKVRGGATLLDTVIYTHQGPLVLKSQEKPWSRNVPCLHALRWLALDPSDELLAYLRIMKAGGYDEFAASLEPFHCPSQNFAFASVSGDIALFHHGLFPRKWKGQGRFILDGSQPGNDWSGWLPRTADPAARNPVQGWLFSANQSPADTTYPFYLGAQYLNGPRAKRLGQLVSESDSLTPEGAFAIMLDDFDTQAADLLPALLAKTAQARFSAEDSSARAKLAAWDFRHAAGNRAPALFDKWWSLLYRSIWADEFGGDSVHYQWPDKERTKKMILEEPNAEWFDDISTPSRENLAFLAARSFREACAALRHTPDWSHYRPVQIRHLARIDAFSSLDVRAGGCADCVNALKTAHGPSWRMVVAMEKEPRGFGIYPGGQSGNPGSAHYAEFIADWAAGRYYPLTFLTTPGSQNGETAYRLQLRGK